ncbi:PadR family transcriptional regulator [Microbacterium sp. SS28]|uniref:PadR family transcriptional regulator n=1 Tax=Microbacterium sp. SS28 TaxID=2919948 RepID=UPI001FAA4729|nr:PadR family transcriptional regulator [Microbacterium sp. SS28]
MSGSYTGGGFGGGFPGRGPGGLGGQGSGLWDIMEQLRGAFEQKVGTTGTRMGKGDVRAAVLALLAEQPMHGYQIIQQIEERSGGSWKPSAGSVYPTLQLLADEGLIAAEESGGRKTYSLTEAGREAAGAAGERPAPWESSGMRDAAHAAAALPKAGMELAQVAAQVARAGTPEQVKQAVDVLDEARRKLYSILAQD